MKKKKQINQNKQAEKKEKLRRELKTKQAIDMLNKSIKTRLGASEVHGVGLFAMRDIKKGETLYADIINHQFDIPYKKFKLLRPEIAEEILGMWPNVITGSHFIFPVTRLQAYCNHSDKPNYDAKNDKALKKIKAGEEIFEDYRLIEGWEKIFSFLTK